MVTPTAKLIMYIASIAVVLRYAVTRRNNSRRIQKFDLTRAVTPSTAPIDVMLPKEIMAEIMKYDLSVTVNCREVSKYWRSVISDRDLKTLVLQSAINAKKLFRDLLEDLGCVKQNDGIYFDTTRQIWREKEEPVQLTNDLIRNVCIAAKSGKYFLEIKESDLLRRIRNSDAINHAAVKARFDDFIVQTEGIIRDEIQLNYTYNDVIIVYRNYELNDVFIIRRPQAVQLSNQSRGLIILIYNLGDFLRACPEKLTKQDQIYRLNVIQYKVHDPLIWTLGVLPNAGELMPYLSFLFLAPWIFSFISPLLPSWNLYNSVATIVGVFLFTSNKRSKSVFFYELAFAVWLLLAVGSSHLINTKTSFKVPLYEAVGNFLWTVVYYCYTEVGVRYLKQTKLDLSKKIATAIWLFVVIVTASTLVRDDENWSIRKIIVLGYNIQYLIAALFYLAISGRIFGITFREMFFSQQNMMVPIKFAVKLSFAMILRLTFQAL